MPNLQVIEKQDLNSLGFLDIHHIFRTIQGEGPFVGTPAVFIRMAGCNLQCPLCDTDYTSQRVRYSPDDLLEKLDEISETTRLIVISGGEPFRQNLTPLVNRLLGSSYQVQVETNGTLWIPELPVEDEDFHIVCSPKTPKLNAELVPYINAFKYILHADSIDSTDGLPHYALEHGAPPFPPKSGRFPITRVARPPDAIFGNLEDIGSIIYVQPVDTGRTHENVRHIQAAIDSCMKYNYTLCLQTQKIIGME